MSITSEQFNGQIRDRQLKQLRDDIFEGDKSADRGRDARVLRAYGELRLPDTVKTKTNTRAAMTELKGEERRIYEAEYYRQQAHQNAYAAMTTKDQEVDWSPISLEMTPGPFPDSYKIAGTIWSGDFFRLFGRDFPIPKDCLFSVMLDENGNVTVCKYTPEGAIEWAEEQLAK